MADLTSKDIERLIIFAKFKKGANFPPDMSQEDIHQEILVRLFNCKVEITSTVVINVIIWARHTAWREFKSRNTDCYASGHYYQESNLDARMCVEKILSLSVLTDREREVVRLMSLGRGSKQIQDQMGLTRQRFHQIKNRVFAKIREYCPSAKYWEPV
jgi:DNA-directed RNA polymerase specialized sigma24 family protein